MGATFSARAAEANWSWLGVSVKAGEIALAVSWNASLLSWVRLRAE